MPSIGWRLRSAGNSPEKSARISNAVAARGAAAVGRRGGRSVAYEGWPVSELRMRAKELGMSGYSSLRKDELIDELRNH